MSRAIAAAAAAAVVGPSRPDEVELLATGMSSRAWYCRGDSYEIVVRVPVGDGRRPLPDYGAEARLLLRLSDLGVPVAPLQVVDVDGLDCSVAPFVRGRRISDHGWSPELVADVAAALGRLHRVEPESAVRHDLVGRFHLARLWPFDRSCLDDHPAAQRWPDRVAVLHDWRDAIIAAGQRTPGVAHTDLHPDHLLVDGGRLRGVLDFGDAIAAPASWDHACLRYYHGDQVADQVLAATGARAELIADERLIGVAFALYKLDKAPDRLDVVERVDRMLPPARDRRVRA